MNIGGVMNLNQRKENNPNWSGGKSKFKCSRCGVVFCQYASEYNRPNRKPPKNVYCSRECMAKGFSIDRDGYVLVPAYNHPNCNAIGFIRLHRLLMERKIGRYLTSDEIVHHIDGDVQNNTIENLQLMDKSTHHKNHAIQYWRNKKGEFTTKYQRHI